MSIKSEATVLLPLHSVGTVHSMSICKPLNMHCSRQSGKYLLKIIVLHSYLANFGDKD